MSLSVVLAVVLGVALIGAIAALVVTELKSPGAAPAGPPPAVVTGREALERIDLGLRTLAAECVRSRRPLPDVYALAYSGDGLALRLAGVDLNAPASWVTDDRGEEWLLDAEQLAGHGGAAGASHPYALAVTIGLDQGSRVLVDLSRASAAIAVTGAMDGVRQLVRAFVAELITGPVGRHAEVTLVGSAAGAELTVGLGMHSVRLHTVATLEEALSNGAEPAHGAASSASADQVTQVYRLIEGSSPVGVEGRTPRLFVLDAAAYRDEKDAVDGLHAGDALLVLGDAPGCVWRFQVEADGSLDTGPLGVRVDVHAGRLSPS
ncbi:hypothetical protein ACWDBD_16085 [Streptomyces sp. NPDC001118]|uniref:hypothetical protein n=1 Tax=Streptomyces sp. CG4 TaxID=408783 RepID=UPI0034E29176